MNQFKPTTNEDKFEAVKEFVAHHLKLRHTGNIAIRFDLANGGITTIRFSVDGKLFPIEAN